MRYLSSNIRVLLLLLLSLFSVRIACAQGAQTPSFDLRSINLPLANIPLTWSAFLSIGFLLVVAVIGLILALRQTLKTNYELQQQLQQVQNSISDLSASDNALPYLRPLSQILSRPDWESLFKVGESAELKLSYSILYLNFLENTSQDPELAPIHSQLSSVISTLLQDINDLLEEAVSRKNAGQPDWRKREMSQPFVVDILRTLQRYCARESQREIQDKAFKCFIVLRNLLDDKSMDHMISVCNTWVQDDSRPRLRVRVVRELIPRMCDQILTQSLQNLLLYLLCGCNANVNKPLTPDQETENGRLVQATMDALKELKRTVDPRLTWGELQERDERLTLICHLLAQPLSRNVPYVSTDSELSSVARMTDWEKLFDSFAPLIVDDQRSPTTIEEDIEIIWQALQRYLFRNKFKNESLKDGILDVSRRAEYEAAYTVLAKLNAARGKRDSIGDTRYDRYKHMRPRPANRYRFDPDSQDQLKAILRKNDHDCKAVVHNINPVLPDQPDSSGIWLVMNDNEINSPSDCSEISALTILLPVEGGTTITLNSEVTSCTSERAESGVGARLTVRWTERSHQSSLEAWLKNHVPWLQ